MPWTFVVIVAGAVLIGTVIAMWGMSRARPLPDYADPDVEDVPLEAFLGGEDTVRDRPDARREG